MNSSNARVYDPKVSSDDVERVGSVIILRHPSLSRSLDRHIPIDLTHANPAVVRDELVQWLRDLGVCR